MTTRLQRRHERGVSLIEALVAFAVMTTGMLAALGLQTHLRFHGDVVKQRAEATRLAQAQMETARAFVQLEGGAEATYDALDTIDDQPIDDATTNTTYRLTRAVQRSSWPAHGSVTVAVGWPDRRGEWREVRLRSVIAGVAPALSGRLSLAADTSPLRPPFGRAGGIPIAAVDRGDGRSVWTPPGARELAWVFDNATGLVVAVCAGPAASAMSDTGDLDRCASSAGRIVTGVVRFAADGDVDAAHAEHPRGAALALDVTLSFDDGTDAPPTFACVDDAPAAPAPDVTLVRFACLVQPGAAGGWSARLNVVPQGWTIGTGANDLRVCRYSADRNRNGHIDNHEHPAHYSAVDAHLTDQNFLVVRGDVACPADRPSDPNSGDVVDSSTVAHQPPPA